MNLVESVHMALRPHHVVRVARVDVLLNQKEPKGLYEQAREGSMPGKWK